MSRFGTDILALTCILGGAALGGAVTTAVVQRADAGPDRSEHMSIRCVQERAEAPLVRVTSGRSDRTIVVRTSNRSPVAACDGVVSMVPSSRVPPSTDMVIELERRLEVAKRQRAALVEQRAALERARAELREAEVAVEVVRLQERKRERR